MMITVDHVLWALGALGSSLIALFVLGRILLSQVEKRLDARFNDMEQLRAASSEQWRASFTALEAAHHQTEQRVTQLLIDLPMQYQRREDAIRQEVAIIHRLDALAAKVDHALRCDRGSCPLRTPPSEESHDRSPV